MPGVKIKDEDKIPSTSEEDARIILKVNGMDGYVIWFRIKKSTQLKKLINAFCHLRSVYLDEFGFFYKGKRLKWWQTPDELGMVEGDELDALPALKGC